VLVNGDAPVEADETFFVNLSNATNGTIIDSQGQGTILNDDVARISINDVADDEGNAGLTPFTFTVSLSTFSFQTITVQYATADGSATAPSDYTATSGTLSFNPGETSKTVTVPVHGDTVIEPDETFTVNLSSPTNAVLLDAQGEGTIRNDDLNPNAACTVTDGNDTIVGTSGNDVICGRNGDDQLAGMGRQRRPDRRQRKRPPDRRRRQRPAAGRQRRRHAPGRPRKRHPPRWTRGRHPDRRDGVGCAVRLPR
jgi:Ca2+-binding RTX toxin-like protein